MCRRSKDGRTRETDTRVSIPFLMKTVSMIYGDRYESTSRVSLIDVTLCGTVNRVKKHRREWYDISLQRHINREVNLVFEESSVK